MGSTSRCRKKGGKKYKSLIATSVKTFALKTYLTNRRVSHGFIGWDETHGTAAKHQEVDIHSALAILKGQLSIHDHFDYTVSKKEWPMMMLLTDHDGNQELTRIIEGHVRDHFVQRDAEIQKLVKERIEKEESKKKLMKMMSRGRKGTGLFKSAVKDVIKQSVRDTSEVEDNRGEMSLLSAIHTALKENLDTVALQKKNAQIHADIGNDDDEENENENEN